MVRMITFFRVLATKKEDERESLLNYFDEAGQWPFLLVCWVVFGVFVGEK